MSLSLNHIILHSLCRDAQGELVSQPRQEELSATETVSELIEEVASSYNKKGGKAFAFFKEDNNDEEDPGPKFAQLLNDQLSGELSFLAFSHKALTRLQQELAKYDFTDGGVLLLAHYTWVASDYLLVALLGDKSGISVDAQLEPSTTNQLDLSRIQLAARVDITQWQQDPGSNRYLSFIKGRAGRKVADFFLDFMSCEEGMDPKVQNQLLMNAVDEYVDANQIQGQARLETKKEVASYCNNQLAAGEELELKELAGIVPKGNEGDFYQFSSDNYDIEERFPADRSQVRKLTKYIGQGGGISLSFEQKLLGERIQYDPQTDTLTIVGLPPNLKEQLRQMGD